ncbi:MAG: hypothetical protein RLO80_06985 [Hyphomonas sp.]
MTAEIAEQAKYFVYVYRIGGVMAYVGKGSGFRMTKHMKASHNPLLSEWITWAQEEGALVQRRRIKRGLTKDQALRLEGRCYEKWEQTLCNINHPYPALEFERQQAEWEDEDVQDFAREHEAWMDAVDAMYDGTLSTEDAIEYGFVEPDQPYPPPAD